MTIEELENELALARDQSELQVDQGEDEADHKEVGADEDFGPTSG